MWWVAVAGVLLASCGDDAGGASQSTDAAAVTTAAASPTAPSVASTTDAPLATSGAPTSAPAAAPTGFDTIAARVVAADGTVCDLCLWLADDAGERRRGLMGVTDLGGNDGMAFVYAEPTATSFYMKDTLLPLSIAFFAADGTFLDAFDMDPCDAEPCPTYPTPDGFSVAVEIAQGGLDELGIATGSRLELLGDCPLG